MIVDTKRNAHWLFLESSSPDDTKEQLSNLLWGRDNPYIVKNSEVGQSTTITSTFTTPYENIIMSVVFQVVGVSIVDIKIHSSDGSVVDSSVST